mmetsp:Transcript_23973/g.32644  ORF Transcript_23973/g.32644 Transcript_23973/m.32644 type:complete len:89 (-) Transcript_23973:48-314(-)
MISAFDILSINIDSVDEIAPAIRDIQQALSQYPNLPPAYEGLGLMEKWCNVLNQKKASDTLSEDEIRQLKFDIDLSLNSFNEKVLGKH